MSKHMILIAMLAVLCQPTAVSAEPAAMVCTRSSGKIGITMVPTPEVAEEIYSAVAKGLGHKVSGRIGVGDGGDRWEVTWDDGKPAVFGGGTLHLTINKCDGSMSGYYMK